MCVLLCTGISHPLWSLTIINKLETKLTFCIFLLYFYCLHYYRCPHFPPFAHLHPAPPPLPSGHIVVCVCELLICSSANPFTLFYPVPPPCSLWQLSVCSVCPCLCFCIVHQFILTIRFHIQVRSYAICLSLTGLFHLAVLLCH